MHLGPWLVARRVKVLIVLNGEKVATRIEVNVNGEQYSSGLRYSPPRFLPEQQQ